MIRAVLVTNVPVPYRVSMLREVAAQSDIELEVIYCAQPHIDPSLGAEAHGFKTHFLTGRYIAMQKRFMHWDRGVIGMLKQIQPDVVITTGFIPTFLYAFGWCLLNGTPHVAMTDGTFDSEAGLTWLHRWARRFVFKRTAAFVGACEGSLKLFRSYRIPDSRLHLSELCIHNEKFNLPRQPDGPDFLFSGRFVEHKRPLFAMQVAQQVAKRSGRRTSIEFLGQGPMEPQLRQFAESIAESVDVRFRGYLPQSELPQVFAAAKVFLFPSEWDAWGLVANEACAAGMPIIISPHAGAAGELVKDGVNGYVLPLNLESWAAAATKLITDEALNSRLGANGRECVSAYNFTSAARGLSSAIRRAAAITAKPPLRVCVVQAVAKEYRQPFFDGLYKRLQENGVKLQVLYSDPNALEKLRLDATDLPSTYGHKVPAYWFMRWHVLYQPVMRHALASDLVIVEQGSKHVINYFLSALSAVGLVRFAYWGHGRNWQATALTFSESLKRAIIANVDWWFVYTKRVGEYVALCGFDRRRITVVNNSVNLEEFRTQTAGLTVAEVQALREQLGITAGAKVGLFCGSMHKDKDLEFLVEASCKLRAIVPSFHLVLVGNGPTESIAINAASQHAWIHYVGRRTGVEKAKLFAIADVFLCPGLVGLAVLDAFAAGLPLFTTDIPSHSPEIDYLESGFNGFVAEPDPVLFAKAIAAVLLNDSELARLRLNVKTSVQKHSLEAMIENFSQGILACLGRS